MDKKITELVYNYTIDGRMADAEYVNKIVSIVSDEYGLKDYIRKPITVFLDDTKKVIGSSYHYDQEKLTIDLNAELKKYRHVSIKNKILLFNLNVLLIILHELDHVHLKKEVENDEEDLTAHFFKLTNPDVSDEECNKRHEIYYDNHDLAPFERRADIKSHLIVNDVLCNLANTSLAGKSLEKIEFINAKEFAKICRHGYKLHGKFTNSPSFDYMKNLCSKDDMMRLAVYHDNNGVAYLKSKEFYGLKERALYGLPLTKREFRRLSEKGDSFKIYKSLDSYAPEIDKDEVYHYEGINNNTFDLLFADYDHIDEKDCQSKEYFYLFYIINEYTTHVHQRIIKRLFHLGYSSKKRYLNDIKYDKKSKRYYVSINDERFDFDILSKYLAGRNSKRELNDANKRAGECHTKSICSAAVIKDSSIMTGYMTVDDMKVLHSVVLKKNPSGVLEALDWTQNLIMPYDQFRKLFNFQELNEVPGSVIEPDLKRIRGLGIDSKAYLTFRDEIIKDVKRNAAVLGLRNK